MNDGHPYVERPQFWVGISAWAATLLDDADAAAARVTMGLVIGTNVQAYDAELAAIAGLTSAANKLPYFTGSGTAALADLSVFARTILDDADAAAVRTTLGLGTMAVQSAGAVAITGGSIAGITDLAVADGGTGASTASAARANLGLVIGTNVQAYDAELAAIAALSSAPNTLPFFTGSGTAALTPLFSIGRDLLYCSSAGDMRAVLGLGTMAVQAAGAVAITGGSIAGITDLAVADGGTGASAAFEARTNLGLVIGTNVQAYDAELAALAGLTSAANKLPYFTGSGTATLADLSVFARTILDDANAATARATLGLGTIATDAALVHQNCVRAMIIHEIRDLLGSDLLLLLIMDETGATTTILDRSGNQHDATLGSNASDLSPSVVGMCPSLLFANAAATEWSVGDHADFQFGSGGTDGEFSLITMCVPTDLTNSELLAKFKTSTNEREWRFGFDSGDELWFYLSSPSGADRIARSYSNALTSDQGSTHVYIATSAGGSPTAFAGLKIYRDAERIDDTDYVTGTFAGLTPGTSPVSNSQALAAHGDKAREMVQIIVGAELDQDTVTQLTWLLRAYAGEDI